MIPKVAPDSDLWSVGALCSQFQESVPTLRKALDEIGAVPTLALNGVSYYSMDVERTELVCEWLAMRRRNKQISKEWTAEPTVPENYRPAR